MHRKCDSRIAGHRDRPADHADAKRVQDAANHIRIVGKFAIVIERQDVEKLHAFAPGHHERT